MTTINEKETFISELHKLIPKHLGLQAVIFSLHEKYASSQSGWTDEDMRKAISLAREGYFTSNTFKGETAFNFHHTADKIIQSLPKNPSSEREAVLFAECLKLLRELYDNKGSYSTIDKVNRFLHKHERI